MIVFPRLRLDQRLDEPGSGEKLLRLVIGGIIATALGALLVSLSGHDPLLAYAALYRGAFGSLNAVSGTINKAVPIGLCALGIAFAYKAKLWNIGAEGQLYFGAFAATGVGLFLPAGVSSLISIPAVLVAGIVGGALWALIPAILRAYLTVNEILSTLMLNYVAILWVNFLVTGPWSDKTTFSFPYSPPIVQSAQFGKLYVGIHAGILIFLAAVAAMILLDRGSRLGYELRVTGDAPRAALYAGIASGPLTVAALTIAGALAGLAGAIEIAGSTTRLQAGLSPGYGFMAILVASLAGGRPVAIVVCALLYAGLLNGGFALQVSGIPPAISTILQALLLLAILGAITLGNYRLRVVWPERTPL